MDIKEELELIRKSQTDIGAFHTLYEAYLPKIFAYIMNRVVNREVAEDITSQSFLAAVEKLHSFDVSRGIKFGSWLYKIAHNKIIDYFRKNKHYFEDLENVNISETEDYDKQLEIKEKQGEIARTLGLLSQKYQEVIALRFYAEMSNKEIAEIWQVRPANVALILHRALKAFKRKYKELYPNAEIFE